MSISCVFTLFTVYCAGQVDRNGTSTIPPHFDHVGAFSEGLAVVELKKKFGYIDQNGRLVIPLEFAGAAAFSDGLALVYTTLGMNLFGKTEGVWLFASAGYIDHIGKFVIESRLIENARNFSEGLAAFEPGASSWGTAKWGYLDKTGKWAIKPHTRAGDFSEGLAPVAIIMDKKTKREKWGYIGKRGQTEVTPILKDIKFGAVPFVPDLSEPARMLELSSITRVIKPPKRNSIGSRCKLITKVGSTRRKGKNHPPTV